MRRKISWTDGRTDGRKDRQKDGWTDRQTEVKQYTPPPSGSGVIKSLFESLELTPKAVSKYLNKVRTGHQFVGSELRNAGITIIILEPFSDNCF